MKNVLIKPIEIYNCWETDDACIVETTKGKKWVCQKFLDTVIIYDGKVIETTLQFIRESQNSELIMLKLKGKSDCNE